MFTKVNCLCSDIHYSSLLAQGEFYQRLFIYSLWFPLGWVTADTPHVETPLTSLPLPLHETYVINVWNVSPVFIL